MRANAEARGSTGEGLAGQRGQAAGNAWRHGLRARAVLLRDEEAAGYRALREAWWRQWSPRGEAEGLLVQRLVDCAWRLMRCAEIDAELLETLRDPEAEQGGLARAFLRGAGEAGGSDPLARLMRYETALERTLDRSARLLNLLQRPWREAGQAAPAAADEGPGRAGAAAPSAPGAPGRRGDGAQGPEPARAPWHGEPCPARALALPEPDDDEPVEVIEEILDAEDGDEFPGDWDDEDADDEDMEGGDMEGGDMEGRNMKGGDAGDGDDVHDAGDDGGPRAGDAPRRNAPRGSAAGLGTDKTGRFRPAADEFPNEAAGRAAPGDPPPRERLAPREPVSRVIAGPRSRFAGPPWE